MNNSDENLSRRGFLGRLIETSALAGIVIAMGRHFQGRSRQLSTQLPAAIQPFNVPGTENLLAVAHAADGQAATAAAIDAAGGMKRFVNAGDKVLIKVNCAFARPSWMGATTSPQVTSEVIRRCYEAGASAVKVTDNPISNPQSCFAKSGLAKAVTEAGAELVLPRPFHFRRMRVNDGVIGTWDVLHQPLDWCDKLIGIPTAKTHNLCGASLAMKNWYGFFGGSRSRFHQDIDRVIVELAEFVTPTLVVLDATRLLVRNGPTGGSSADVVEGNTVAASTDQVAVDAFAAELLGLDSGSLKFITMASQKGLGTARYKTLRGFVEVTS